MMKKLTVPLLVGGTLLSSCAPQPQPVSYDYRAAQAYYAALAEQRYLAQLEAERRARERAFEAQRQYAPPPMAHPSPAPETETARRDPPPPVSPSPLSSADCPKGSWWRICHFL
jgi:hypothetical protein